MFYRTFSDYAEDRFGTKVYKVPVDARFTCPNRDGTKGVGGCTFCRVDSFRPDYVSGTDSVVDQFHRGRELFQEKNAELFLGYFQTNTNTYAPVDQLESIYREILEIEDVVGLCIGTRPDCVSDAVVALLDRLGEQGHEIWLEVGLQSSDKSTLERVNRCHGFQEYLDTAQRVNQSDNVKLCSHVIFGLPGEGPEQMKTTVRDVKKYGLDGIKFHQLQVIEGTRMASEYREGRVKPIDFETYRELVAWSLDTLPTDVVVHRIMADNNGEQLLAPEWKTSKHQLREWLRQK